MTKEADSGAGVDEVHTWDARLDWAYGLIADDPSERTAALARLTIAKRNVGDALMQFNNVWSSTQSPGRQLHYRDPALQQAIEVHRDAARHSLPDALWNRRCADIREWPGLPYALLFLEWEARYPQAWTQHAKKWGTKEDLLRDMAVAGHNKIVRAKLTDLIEIVIQRPYRCKDRDYVRVARAVDSADLRERLGTAAESDNPWARRHAGYVLWLLDRPELPNSLHVWRKWIGLPR
ncbi:MULTISPECIES: hypothetical protein [Streptomyces]|uniref:hypothetical protein n=1 Tax=Streptomyces TaxID=1883 RepID=UPI001FD3C740|nr:MULTISPECIES: hypothetical protein [Streptomyces]